MTWQHSVRLVSGETCLNAWPDDIIQSTDHFRDSWCFNFTFNENVFGFMWDERVLDVVEQMKSQHVTEHMDVMVVMMWWWLSTLHSLMTTLRCGKQPEHGCWLKVNELTCFSTSELKNELLASWKMKVFRTRWSTCCIFKINAESETSVWTLTAICQPLASFSSVSPAAAHAL